MTKSKAAWLTWAAGSLLAFGVIETRAILDKEADTTLSATWWSLRTKLATRLLIFPPLVWCGNHLFNPLENKTGGKDDVAAVMAGVTLALLADYKLREGR